MSENKKLKRRTYSVKCPKCGKDMHPDPTIEGRFFCKACHIGHEKRFYELWHAMKDAKPTRADSDLLAEAVELLKNLEYSYEGMFSEAHKQRIAKLTKEGE